MRFLSAPGLEAREQALLPQQFGKRYDPAGPVSIDDASVLATAGVDLVPLDGERLAIEPDTASWAFLAPREAELVAELAEGRPFAWLAERWPREAWDRPERFVQRLYRRGLLRVDGRASVDADVFHDSPNVREGHLVELLITEKCNLGCVYCLAGASQQMSHMSPEVARRAVDLAFAMADAETFTFEFSGGEPFLRFDLMRELVDYIRHHPRRRERSVYFCVQTNGTLLDAERVEWLKRNAVIVGLSLDGDPGSHNRSRPQVNGGESFSKVLRGLDLLQRAGLDVGVLVVLNHDNAASAQGLVDFLVDNGISRLKLNPVAFLGTARENWQRTGLTQEEVIAYFQDFARLLVGQDHDLIEANVADMLRHLMSKQRASRCMRGHCGAGETFQAVSAGGDIYPCGRATQSPGLALGNVLTERRSLAAPGRGSLVIQQIHERRPKTLEGCVTCHYRELCQAGCSAQAFERYGTVRHRTPECAFFKTMYPFLMRWLTFDSRALAYFDRRGYFGGGAGDVELVQHPFLPE